MKKIFHFLFAALTVCGCGGNNSAKNQSLAEGASGDITAYENSEVNAVEQARPTIMVLPGDNLLKRFHCLKTEEIDGRTVHIRDYGKYMTANADNKSILSTIQDAFVQANYPLQDLEQTLKQLETQEAADLADGIQKDAKTMLLTVAQPDIILELDYASNIDVRAPLNEAHKMSFTLNALDAYTNNVISSSAISDIMGENAATAISGPMEKAMPKLLADIQKSFSDILTRGRNVTVRIAVGADSNINLNDESIEGDTYADWIVDYVKTKTVKGSYKMQRNTDKELYFVNCRIPLLNEDGTQFGVYDWAREMAKSMRSNLGVQCTNKSQGLGEILITINGLK